MSLDAAQDVAILNLDSIYETCDGDEEFVAEVLDAFEGSARVLLDSFRESLAESDWNQASRSLHTLKGAAFSAGALRLAETCKGFENQPDEILGSPGIAVDVLESVFAEASGAMAAWRRRAA